MNDRDTQNWQGDAARALVRLKVTDPETAEVVLRQLGLDLQDVAKIGLTTDDDPDPIMGDPPWGGLQEDKRDSNVRRPPREPDKDLPLLTPVQTRTHPQDVRAWGLSEPLEPTTVEHIHAVLPYEPLFDPMTARQLVVPPLSADIPSGEIDVAKLIERICRGRPVSEMPWLSRRSLSRGVQLLVDCSEAMQPFARDQEEVTQWLHDVVGESLIETLRFRDVPTRGAGTGRIRDWNPYVLPPPGRTVLVLTSLGVWGPSRNIERAFVDEWAALAAGLKQQGSRLVVFVPYPADRWDPVWEDLMVVIRWDRMTTASHVGAALTSGADR